MKAKQNSVRLILLIFSMLLCGPYVYSQNNKCDTTFYVKFDFVKYGRILDENFIDKLDRAGVLRFSKATGANEVNGFYINKKKLQRKIGLVESKKISFTEVDIFVKYMLKYPQKHVKINLLEVTRKGELILYYDVRWERKTSTQ